MRDVFVTSSEIEDPEKYVRDMLVGEYEEYSADRLGNGDIIINVTIDGLRQRFSFSED